VAFSWFLYRRDKRLAELRKGIVYCLIGARFVSIFLILFLLLSPVLRYLSIYFDKPVILIAYDNSESMGLYEGFSNDSAKVQDFMLKLKNRFDNSEYLFGEQLSEGNQMTYLEKETSFDALFDEIQRKYTNYNVGALVIVSDGIFNKGVNPVYKASNLSFPIYTVALGDTMQKKDIAIKSIYSNKISFTGDLFPVEILIDAYGFKGQRANLTIYNQGKLIKTESIEFEKDEFSKMLEFYLPAEKSGLQAYTFKIDEKANEFSVKNNQMDLMIDVVDNRKKILILTSTVHPDIGAIKQAISANKNMVVESFMANDFTKPLSDYQLVIFYQLPSREHNLQRFLKPLKDAQIPVLFVYGQNTDIGSFNSLNSGLEIKQSKTLYDLALPEFNTQFKLFETDAGFKSFIEACPPLNVPFADFVLSSNFQVFMHQKIKGISTKMPLMGFSSNLEGGFAKAGFIMGEGIWNWRMKNYLMYENHRQFDEFVYKMTNYLASDIKKERFMVFSERMYQENEEVTMIAEFYNPSFELINSPEIDVQIANDQGKEYIFQFSRAGLSYSLNAGRLPVGLYKFSAQTNFENKLFKKSGEFRVVPIKIEHINLTANHSILNALSLKSGGKMYRIENVSDLYNDLIQNSTIRPVSHSATGLIGLNELKWLLFVLLFVLMAEWFARKYFGTY
jgi:hypothetical protein